MISQQELPQFIENSMPELSKISHNEQSHNAYAVVKQLLQYTTTSIARQNMNAAKQCLALADQLYQMGNNVVKNAIENVFVFSFSHAFFHKDHNCKDALDIVPESLYELYRRQLVNSHL
jgi:peptidoglycan biosynthesis protein MviN/MurJ (putative lipid II flippase)